MKIFGCDVTSFKQEAVLQDRPWFAGVCERKTAEETVLRFKKVCVLIK